MAQRKLKVKVKIRRKPSPEPTKAELTPKILIPSTSLYVVGVHKIGDSMSCSRKYFWRWILNLVPKRINLNFWFGSVVHAGVEQLNLGKSIAFALKTMRKVSKRELSGFNLDTNTLSEASLQFEIGKLIISTYAEFFGAKIKESNIIATEQKFQLNLKQSPVMLVGMIDGYSKRKSTYTLLEYKTASQITSKYFQRLKFDKQINGYALGLKTIVDKFPSTCDYMVFRKPGIRQKQNETVPQFLTRFEDDLHARKDFYFILHEHRFGKKSIPAVLMDIECATFDLYSKYSYLGEDKLLNPYNWPRNDCACLDYGICPYFILCNNCSQYKLFLQFFRMRDIRYVEEQAELNEKRVDVTTPPKGFSRRMKANSMGEDYGL